MLTGILTTLQAERDPKIFNKLKASIDKLFGYFIGAIAPIALEILTDLKKQVEVIIKKKQFFQIEVKK